MINFGEIGWERFEELADELLKAEGLETRRLGRGPGQLGKDIIAWELVGGPLSKLVKRKWLVECKFTNGQGAIGEEDVFNVSDRVIAQEAHGYLLITNARLKVNLERTLNGLRDKIGIDLWLAPKISEKVILNDNIFRTFFPKSFIKWIKDNRLIYLSQMTLFRSPLGYILNYLQFLRYAPLGVVKNDIYENIIDDLIIELRKIIDSMDDQLRIIRQNTI